MKTIKQLEQEIEVMGKEYSDSGHKGRITREVISIRLNQLTATLKQTIAIKEMIEKWGKEHTLNDELDGIPRKLIDSSWEDWEEILTKINGVEEK